MSKEISPGERKSALHELLSYPPIVESPALHHFLEFLGEKALNGGTEHIKEYAIATQVFKKSKSFDPRMDPIVRVHASHLREKVDQYYQGAGHADAVRIEIPKGSYLLKFSRRRSRLWVPESAFRWVSLALLAVLLAQSALWVRSLHLQRVASQPRRDHPESPLLAPFLAGPSPPVVAFSNDLFLKDKDGNLLRLKAEEKLDLASRMQVKPQNSLVSPALRGGGPFYLDADYTGTGDAMCIYLLTRYFTERGLTLEFVPSSLFNLQELRDKNVIFLGSPRENIVLSKMNIALDMQFVRRNNPANRPFLAIENLRPRPGEQQLYEARLSPLSGNPEEVYALISYLPGFAANSHFLVLAGESTAGTQCACEYAVDGGVKPELPPFWYRTGQAPPLYQIVLKTSVRDFSPFRTEYVTLHVGTQPEPVASASQHP
jgi:hypothetical protein